VDAFAITIHNSQGSEFDEVIIALPEKESLLLTRELLYTAVTRAKSKVRIYGTEQVLRKSIETKTTRHSGLPDRLRDSTKLHAAEK
jgi:exodeoxyribonuclease V alpha subunit